MTARSPRPTRSRGAWLLLAALALCNSGCLALALGAAGGATAVGVAYARGKVHATYAASFSDTWAATRTALGELGLPILEEKRESIGSGFLRTRVGDDSTVRIYLDTQPSKFPTEGPVTRVGVRVDFLGDYDVSTRILNQVSAHLAVQPPPGAPPVLGAPTPVPTSGVVGAGWTGPQPPPPPPAVGNAPPRTTEPPLPGVAAPVPTGSPVGRP